jgi:hypothetical protein
MILVTNCCCCWPGIRIYRVFHKFENDIVIYISLNWLEISKPLLDMLYPDPGYLVPELMEHPVRVAAAEICCAPPPPLSVVLPRLHLPPKGTNQPTYRARCLPACLAAWQPDLHFKSQGYPMMAEEEVEKSCCCCC